MFGMRRRVAGWWRGLGGLGCGGAGFDGFDGAGQAFFERVSADDGAEAEAEADDAAFEGFAVAGTTSSMSVRPSGRAVRV
jgi:hypothetical protein